MISIQFESSTIKQTIKNQQQKNDTVIDSGNHCFIEFINIAILNVYLRRFFFNNNIIILDFEMVAVEKKAKLIKQKSKH